MIKSQNNQIQLKYLKVLRMLQFFLKELVWISLCIVSGSLNCLNVSFYRPSSFSYRQRK